MSHYLEKKMNQQIGELRNFFHGVTQRIQKIEQQLTRTDDKVDKALYGLDVIRDKQFQTDSLILNKNLQTLDESELRTIRLLFGASPASIDQIVPPQEVMSDDLLGELGSVLHSETLAASDTLACESSGNSRNPKGLGGESASESESDSAINKESSK